MKRSPLSDSKIGIATPQAYYFSTARDPGPALSYFADNYVRCVGPLINASALPAYVCLSSEQFTPLLRIFAAAKRSINDDADRLGENNGGIRSSFEE